MRLDLFSLKLFVDIVEERSIGKGAAKNCIAMSAASKRMSDLEQKLGAPLLLRQSRGVVTTGAGATLYKGMTETLSRLARLAAAVGESANGTQRPVRVMANLTSLARDLPASLKAFAASNPAVAIELDGQPTATTLQAVSRGDADLGVVAPIVPYPSNIVAFRYCMVRHVLLVPADHPLAATRAVTFDRVGRYDTVALKNEGGWDALLRKMTQERGGRLRARVGSFDALCHLVASGFGVAIVPASTADLHAASLGLRVLDIAEPWAELPLDVCVRDVATLAPEARQLLDHLCGRTRDEVLPLGGFLVPKPVADRVPRGFADSTFSH